MGEFRKYVRRAVNVEFKVRDADEPLTGEILFDATDLSEGGAYLRTDLLLEVGEKLEVSFQLPGQRSPVYIRARVAWVARNPETKGEAGMGLEFIDLRQDERDAIAQFVRVQTASALAER